jgi:4-hydroxy-2-oxoglutarate aldolase
VLVRTPSFFKAQMTTDVFAAHYRAVADASPVPILLYNVTMYTGVNLLPEAAIRLADHPNIIGMKESGSDIVQIAEFVNRTPPRFSVLAGSALTLYASLCVGVTGAVLALAAVVPELCVRVYDLVQSGRHAEAAALQHQLVPLARSVGSVHGVAGLKAALDLVGYAGGPPRSPLLPVPPAAIATLREQLNALQAVTAG